jgi:glycosyltransferase involved in cell wall biosynthesis
MNVMEIISGRSVNGAVVHCLTLSEELVRRGHRVLLVCRPDAWLGREAVRRGLPLEVIASDLHRWPPDELRRVARIVEQEQVDVLHTHMSRAHFFGILLRWLAGVPSVATAHSNHVQLHWMFNDAVIAGSAATLRYQRQWNFVRAGWSEAIHPFLDRAALAPAAPDARGRARRRLGLADDVPLVGLVGNVTHRKGIDVAVAALPKIVGFLPQARLVVIGHLRHADYVAEVQAAARRLGVASHILWLGYRDDVRELLPALDVYIQPSLVEPLGLGILEAMAAELPVVASRVGGIPEIVVAGETGILVPPAQSEALADWVAGLLAAEPSQRRAMGRAGRQRVLAEFSPDSQVTRIEAVLARVCRPCVELDRARGRHAEDSRARRAA